MPGRRVDHGRAVYPRAWARPAGGRGRFGAVGRAHRACVPGRGGLRFAFYGRVSTEDWQDPVTSRARQREQAGVLVAGVWCGSFLWWLGLIAAAGFLRMSFQRQHLVWINRGSGGILVFAGVMLLGSLVFEHWA